MDATAQVAESPPGAVLKIHLHPQHGAWHGDLKKQYSYRHSYCYHFVTIILITIVITIIIHDSTPPHDTAILTSELINPDDSGRLALSGKEGPAP